MQTRDYDDYIYVDSTLGFRKVDDDGIKIDISKETDGYCNVYADNISVSYLHSMNDAQINAIHFFEENHNNIFHNILENLKEASTTPKLSLGFRHVNILNKEKDNFCYAEYVFINENNDKVILLAHKNEIIKSKKTNSLFLSFQKIRNFLSSLFKSS
jgi:hypothetical protein